jgi:hypothetical protein
LATHSAPGSKIWAGRRVIGKQLDQGADAYLTDMACHFNDRPRTFHSTTIKRQPNKG